MKVLLTGGSGQLGAAIAREFDASHDVIAPPRAELDITHHAGVMKRVRDSRPDVIVNCAAYNDVDGAEDHALEALAANAFAVKSLAEAAKDVGATLVHYSTDFVFGGDANRPYTEEDEPQPRSFYAASKLLGEWFARDVARHYVLRVESLFGGSLLGSSRKSSIDRIADSIIEGRDAVVFTDRTVSPSLVQDVAKATLALVERRAPCGLYHCVNSGSCTWLELAEAISALLGVEARLVPRTMADVRLRVPRPLYCALSNSKLAAAGVAMPTWRDAIAQYVRLRRS